MQRDVEREQVAVMPPQRFDDDEVARGTDRQKLSDSLDDGENEDVETQLEAEAEAVNLRRHRPTALVMTKATRRRRRKTSERTRSAARRLNLSKNDRRRKPSPMRPTKHSWKSWCKRRSPGDDAGDTAEHGGNTNQLEAGHRVLIEEPTDGHGRGREHGRGHHRHGGFCLHTE